MKKEKMHRKAHLLRDVVAQVREKRNYIPTSFRKPTMFLLLVDVFWSRLVYGTGIDDYFDFRFYSLNCRGRKSFATVRDKLHLSQNVNDPTGRKRIWNKTEFPKYYGELMHRVTLDLTTDVTDEQLQVFLDRVAALGANRIICKPFAGGNGQGIFIIDLTKEPLKTVDSVFARFDVMIEELFSANPHLRGTRIGQHHLILESMLENHPDLGRLHPASLNTMRIPTLIREGKPEIMGCYLRIGRDGSVVDNINSGGMCTEVDLATGVVCVPAIDHAGIQYVCHPTTGETIVGMKIPYWEEVKEIVLRAAMITPEVRYVGWDVAVTPNGPALIEGNSAGSMAIQQIPRNIGKRYLYADLL